jgi:hypothetical protein
MTKVILSPRAIAELKKVFLLLAHGLKDRDGMIPGLYWTIETKIWADKRGAEVRDSSKLGTPTDVVGPCFYAGPIERNTADPETIITVEGDQYSVSLPPEAKDRPAVRIDFGFFIAD